MDAVGLYLWSVLTWSVQWSRRGMSTKMALVNTGLRRYTVLTLATPVCSHQGTVQLWQLKWVTFNHPCFTGWISLNSKPFILQLSNLQLERSWPGSDHINSMQVRPGPSPNTKLLGVPLHSMSSCPQLSSHSLLVEVQLTMHVHLQ